MHKLTCITDLQDRQARDSAAQAAALAQPTTITGQTSLMFESDPATDAIPAEAPVSATHPPMLVAVGGAERPEAPRAPAAGATNGNVVNSSGFSASSSALSSAKQHAAAAAANNTPADLPDLSEDSAEYDEEEEDYDLESDPESDDSSPPTPVPPGHKQP